MAEPVLRTGEGETVELGAAVVLGEILAGAAEEVVDPRVEAVCQKWDEVTEGREPYGSTSLASIDGYDETPASNRSEIFDVTGAGGLSAHLGGGRLPLALVAGERSHGLGRAELFAESLQTIEIEPGQLERRHFLRAQSAAGHIYPLPE